MLYQKHRSDTTLRVKRALLRAMYPVGLLSVVTLTIFVCSRNPGRSHLLRRLNSSEDRRVEDLLRHLNCPVRCKEGKIKQQWKGGQSDCPFAGLFESWKTEYKSCSCGRAGSAGTYYGFLTQKAKENKPSRRTVSVINQWKTENRHKFEKLIESLITHKQSYLWCDNCYQPCPTCSKPAQAYLLPRFKGKSKERNCKKFTGIHWFHTHKPECYGYKNCEDCSGSGTVRQRGKKTRCFFDCIGGRFGQFCARPNARHLFNQEGRINKFTRTTAPEMLEHFNRHLIQKQVESKDPSFIEDERRTFWESIPNQKWLHQKLCDYNKSFEKSEPSDTADHFFSTKVQELLVTEPKYKDIMTYYGYKGELMGYVNDLLKMIKVANQITKPYQAELFESLPQSEQETVWSYQLGHATVLTTELYRKNRHCRKLIRRFASGDSGVSHGSAAAGAPASMPAHYNDQDFYVGERVKAKPDPTKTAYYGTVKGRTANGWIVHFSSQNRRGIQRLLRRMKRKSDGSDFAFAPEKLTLIIP